MKLIFLYLLISLNTNLIAQPLNISQEDSLEYNILKNVTAKYSRERFIDINDYILYRDSIFEGNYRNFLDSSLNELEEKFGNRTYREIYKEWVRFDNKLIGYLYNWTRKSLLVLDTLILKNLLKTDGEAKYIDTLKLIKDNVKRILTEKTKGDTIDGFNPRPPKNRLSPQICNTFFILGRLSNHTYGNAIDVNPHKNPILDTAEWSYIQKVINFEVDRSLADSKDEEILKKFWENMVYANSEFVKNNQNQLDSLKTLNSEMSDSLIFVNFIFNDYPCLYKYKNGFFDFPWELVSYCVLEKNMRWGIAFEHVVDIHHFEIPR